ncbi:molybdopterin cofactor-binding domain-containing protein [Streptosporangium sp. G11]|uniref:molybdopterin cofactor-binding domain-containing protein n=1 Tax=Streptosporangium sp. G11 TaxID=3436926 RepID=UPI003EBE1F2B
MGPGTYTSMTQVAADALGLAVRAVTFRLDDTIMPPAPVHGGSLTMSSVGSTVQDGCDKLRLQAIRLAVEDERSPLHGAAAGDVIVREGRLHLKENPGRGETYRQLLARNNRTHLETLGSYTPGRPQSSMYAYGAVFAEVAVDRRLGLVRVRRMLGVYDAGRIISPKLADSQAIGGIGAALLEHTVTDPRDGETTTVFAINRSTDRPMSLRIDARALGGARIVGATTLTDRDVYAGNTADAPDRIAPRPNLDVRHDPMTVLLPPVSWNVIRLA